MELGYVRRMNISARLRSWRGIETSSSCTAGLVSAVLVIAGRRGRTFPAVVYFYFTFILKG